MVSELEVWDVKGWPDVLDGRHRLLSLQRNYS